MTTGGTEFTTDTGQMTDDAFYRCSVCDRTFPTVEAFDRQPIPRPAPDARHADSAPTDAGVTGVGGRSAAETKRASRRMRAPE
jgi:hypothetical protein